MVRPRTLFRAAVLVAALGAAPAALDAGAGGPAKVTRKKKPLEVAAWAGVAVGKASSYHPREWMPITIQLVNNTRTDRRKNTKGVTYGGDIVISSSYSISGQSLMTYVTRHTIEYESPEQSVKRYTAGIWLQGSEMSVDVDVYSGGISVGLSKVPVTRTPNESPLVALVQGRNSPKKFWKVMALRGRLMQRLTLNYDVRNRPYVHACVPAALPRCPEHYAFADAVIVLGAPEGIFDEQVFESLLGYAGSGGALVVASGSDFDRYASKKLAKELGVFMSGSKVLTLDALPGLTRAFGGKDLDLKKGLRVPKLAVLPGAEVISAEYVPVSKLSSGESITPRSRPVAGTVAVPTVVRSPSCAGQVTAVAMDLDSDFFEKWEGRYRFIDGILGRSHRPLLSRTSEASIPAGGIDPLRLQLGETLDKASVVKHQPKSWVAMFLIVYMISIVPMSYLVFNAFGRRELAWFCAPILSLAFAVYAYSVGYWGKAFKLSVTQISLVETSAKSRVGRTTSYSAIYSPVRDSYDIDLGRGTLVNHLPVPVKKRGKQEFLLQVDHCGTTMLRGIYILARSMRFIETRSRSDLGGSIDGSIDDSGGRVKITIANETDYDLTGCFVAVGNRAVYIGDVPSGWSNPVEGTTVSPSKALKLSEENAAGLHASRHMSMQAAVALSSALEREWQNLATGALVGWSAEPAQALKVNDTPLHSTGMTVVVCRLPVVRTGGPATITGGLWIKSNPKEDAAQVYPTAKLAAMGPVTKRSMQLAQGSPAEIETTFRPTMPVFGAVPESLTVRCKTTGRATQWTLSILDPGKRTWTKLGRAFPGDGKARSFDVKDPGRYVNPVTCEFRLQLQASCGAQWSGNGVINMLDAEMRLKLAETRNR